MKTVLIGLDGATWKVVDPLIEDGHMPNLKFLVEKGLRSTLESTVPPITGCAWLSLSTSLNPGKTGVIDFLKLDKDLNLKPVSSSDFKGRSFWDLLSKAGKRCVVLDYPMLHPAYPINGAIISTWNGSLYTFPKRLKNEIQKLVGNYDIFVGYHEERYDDIDLFLHDMNNALEKKIKVTGYLLNHIDWDVFVNVISFTDWIQHRMWHYIDKTHPMYNERNISESSSRFADFWRRIDGLVQEALDYADYVFVFSDHGFGSHYGCFNLAKWLEMKGYLAKKQRFKLMFKPVLSILAKTSLAAALPEKIKKKGRGFISVAADIDLSKSKVYVVGHTIPFGAIYINVKGRNLMGIVSNGQEYETLKRDLTNSLLNLKKDVGRNVEVTVFDTKEIYSGSQIELLPDLIFTVNDWSSVVVKDFYANFLYSDTPYSNRHTGSHKLNGIFVAYGPDIKEGVEIETLKIFDIAPTILHMFDTPIPLNMDGRAVKEIFKDDSKLAKKTVKYQEIEKERIRKAIIRLKKRTRKSK